MHQFTVYAANTPIQYAIAEYIDNEDEYLKLSSFYQQKRDFFNNLLAEIGFDLVPSSGTYFQTINFSAYSDENDFQLAERLTKKYGIAAIPMSSFYHDKNNTANLRFCFAKTEKTLLEAAKKLSNFHKEAKKQLNLF